MTPCLYHGPGARDRAVREAGGEGFRPVAPPMGDDGLKVDDARALVEILGVAPVGDKRGSLVLGPLDRTTPEAGDALLKTLEDYGEGPTRVFAWAWDLSGVLPTIRSRTLPVWCPGADPLAHLAKKSQALYDALAAGKLHTVLELLGEEPDDYTREDLLLALLGPLSRNPLPESVGGGTRAVWQRVRPLLNGKGVSRLVAATALMGLDRSPPLLEKVVRS